MFYIQKTAWYFAIRFLPWLLFFHTYVILYGTQSLFLAINPLDQKWIHANIAVLTFLIVWHSKQSIWQNLKQLQWKSTGRLTTAILLLLNHHGKTPIQNVSFHTEYHRKANDILWENNMFQITKEWLKSWYYMLPQLMATVIL